MKIARWLQHRDEVIRVLHPGLQSDPGHTIWKRDYKGSSGLFGVELKRVSDKAMSAFFNGFEHFGLGYSWGGFESLVIPSEFKRTAKKFDHEGPIIRFHAGLEEADDLIADIDAAFARMKAAS